MCICEEASCFKPEMSPACCGIQDANLLGCIYAKQSACIMKGHNAFDSMGGNDDTICITQIISSLVKPLCLEGSKPVCKGSSKGWCCSSRCAYPCDDDITPSFGCCFVQLCLCNPFQFKPEPLRKVDPLVALIQTNALTLSLHAADTIVTLSLHAADAIVRSALATPPRSSPTTRSVETWATWRSPATRRSTSSSRAAAAC